jgi:hypothetical protein
MYTNTPARGGAQASGTRLVAELETFEICCEAAASDYAARRVELVEAVDALQDFAFSRDLVDAVGQDRIQAVMAAAFTAWRPDPRVAASTLAAAEFLIQQNDPQRLKRWLDKHSPEERAAIWAHVQKEGARHAKAVA